MRAWLPCSVQVVTDDPSVLLPEFLRSIAEAGMWPEAVIVVDNAPSGRPRPEPEPGLPVTWLRNPRPQPAGRSLNQALSLARSRVNGLDPSQTFVVFATPDLWLAPDSLARLIEVMQEQLLLGYTGPKIRRAHVAGSLDGERLELELTDIFEQAGFVTGFLGRRKAVGMGEPDQGQYDAVEDLEPAPACILFRWSALDRVSRHGPWVPDEASYEQAIGGLLRRMRALREKGRVLPEAVAWRLVARPEMR
jgi:GT2 family glycosyltransferase